MILRPGLRAELGWVVLGISVATLSGLFLGRMPEFITLTLLSYLTWHFVQAIRLSLWLDKPKRYSRPYAVGIWRETLTTIQALRERGRKRKRKLARMLNGFHESTSALPDATVVIDGKDHMEWWNGAAATMLSLDRKRDKGLPVSQVIKDPVFRDYLAVGEYQRPIQMPAPVDGSISLELRVVPYGKGKRLLQARDITRLQQLETVRRDFVANVSHEMRTPLTVIHGYLETMQDSADACFTPWRRIIEQMSRQTTRMQRVVGDLLLLSRLETGQSSEGQVEVDVPSLVRRLRQEADNLSAMDGHVIKVDIEEGLNLLANPDELESAFSNLVFNAVRYTPSGGEIVLTWTMTGQGPCFSVRDTGIGIDKAHIPRLTERFYRVDVGRSRQSGGTGLGLAIVKHALTRHNAQLSIESQPGKGSLFCCIFPKTRAYHRNQAPSRAIKA